MTESMLEHLKKALSALTEYCYHYVADPNSTPPYITWMEDGGNDLSADDLHAERCYTGSAHLFTKVEEDPLFSAIQAALEGIGASWYLNSVQYEEDTGLIHYEWYWEVI